MAASIADLAVKLSLNAEEFNAKLQGAQAALATRGNAMAGIAAGIGSRVSKGLSAFAGNPVSAVEGMLGSLKGLLTSIPLVGSAFAALPTSVGGFVGWLKEGIDHVTDLDRQAKKLGVSIEAVQAIELYAGAASEGMGRALFHLSKELGDGASGAGQTAAMFQALGLDAAALSKLPLEQSLGQVADKLNELTHYGDKAYAAFQLFGKTGFEILPALAKGSQGLEQAAQRIRDMGGAFSAADAGKALEAKKAMKEMGQIMASIRDQAAVEFAPVLAELAGSFNDMVKGAGGLRPLFAQLAGDAALLGAELLDAGVGFGLSIAAAMDSIKEITGDLKAVIDAAKWAAHNTTPAGWLGLYGGGEEIKRAGDQGKTVADMIKERADALRKVYANSRGGPVAGAAAAAAEAAANAAVPAAAPGLKANQEVIAGVNSLTEKLAAQVAAYGLAGDAAERYKLAQKGATPGQLARVDGMLAELKALEKITTTQYAGLNLYAQTMGAVAALNDSLAKGQVSAEGYARAWDKLGESLQKAEQGKAAALFEQSATPLEKYASKVYEIQTLMRRGLLDAQTYARALGHAGEEMIALNQAAMGKHPAATDATSQEAFKTILRSNDQPGNGADALKDALKVQTEIQRRQEQWLREIARQIDGGPLVRVGRARAG